MRWERSDVTRAAAELERDALVASIARAEVELDRMRNRLEEVDREIGGWTATNYDREGNVVNVVRSRKPAPLRHPQRARQGVPVRRHWDAPVRATQAAAHPAGTLLRCSACGKTIIATGLEYAAICTNGDRHKATQMRPCQDAASRERDGR